MPTPPLLVLHGLLDLLHIPVECPTLAAVPPTLLLMLLESLLGHRLPVPVRQREPETLDDEVALTKLVLGTIADDVLAQDLTLVDPRRVCRGSEADIAVLVMALAVIARRMGLPLRIPDGERGESSVPPLRIAPPRGPGPAPGPLPSRRRTPRRLDHAFEPDTDPSRLLDLSLEDERSCRALARDWPLESPRQAQSLSSSRSKPRDKSNIYPDSADSARMHVGQNPVRQDRFESDSYRTPPQQYAALPDLQRLEPASPASPRSPSQWEDNSQDSSAQGITLSRGADAQVYQAYHAYRPQASTSDSAQSYRRDLRRDDLRRDDSYYQVYHYHGAQRDIGKYEDMAPRHPRSRATKGPKTVLQYMVDEFGLDAT